MSVWKLFKRSKIGRMVRNMLYVLLDPLFWRSSEAELASRLSSATTPEQYVDLLWHFQGKGYYRFLEPNQDRDELIRMAHRVAQVDPKIIVEVGTRNGGSLLLWTQMARQPELIVSIDLPDGYSRDRERLYRVFNKNKPGSQLELLRADSQQEASVQMLVPLLNNHPIDFLFIDGDHRYDGVKRDYELYMPLVRPGGLIAFHDIRPSTYDRTAEVYRLWEEIKSSGAICEEIVHEPYSGRYGFGLLTKQG